MSPKYITSSDKREIRYITCKTKNIKISEHFMCINHTRCSLASHHRLTGNQRLRASCHAAASRGPSSLATEPFQRHGHRTCCELRKPHCPWLYKSGQSTTTATEGTHKINASSRNPSPVATATTTADNSVEDEYKCEFRLFF